MKTCRPFALLALLLILCAGAGAAEFDIDSGRVVLRQLQYCTDCGSALLVTDVRPGALVRCPDCGKEEARLAPEYVLTQLYQMCRVCGGPLNPEGRKAGDVIACGNCRTRQSLTADAFRRGAQSDGLGYVPGFPPGAGKKTLLYSPNIPDAAIAMIPLEGGDSELPLPADWASGNIPPPPEDVAALRRQNDPHAAVPADAVEEPDLAAGDIPDTNAVAVPVVTADLFGVQRSGAGGRGVSAPDRVVARVNGEPVYAREVEGVAAPVIARLRSGAAAADAGDLAAREQALRETVLDRLIDRTLVLQEARRLGFVADRAEVRAREAELGQLLAGTGVDVRREAASDVTMRAMRRRYAEKPGAASPEAVREFYARHKAELMQPRLVALDQLVIFEDRFGKKDARNYRDIAGEVMGRLESGEPFASLREKYDEFARQSGRAPAEPALQPLGAYAAQVVAAGGELRKGGVFGPLFMAGMAVFGKVVDERQEGPVPFAEVESEIRKRLEAEAEERNFTEWLGRLRERARVEKQEVR